MRVLEKSLKLYSLGVRSELRKVHLRYQIPPPDPYNVLGVMRGFRRDSSRAEMKATELSCQNEILLCRLSLGSPNVSHPTFISFIDTFLARCSDAPLQPSVKMDILYSIAHSITYMTASFLRAASFSLTPISLKSLFPPPPFIPPLRWAPGTLLHAPRHRTFGTTSLSTGNLRRRASSKAFVARSPQLTGRVTGDDAVELPP